MRMTSMLFLSLALVYSVEPKVQIDISWHSCTGIIANYSDGIFTVVSDSEVLVSRQGVLSLQNASKVTLSETNLQHQPDELTAYNLTEAGNEVLHIVASTNAGEHSSINRVSYCRYFYWYNVFLCRGKHRYDPPTNFVASVYISNHNQVSVYAVYLDANDELACYDVKHGHPRGSVALPQNCTCNSSRCLAPVSEPKGQVIVQCDNGNSYLYEIYNGNFEFLPPDVKLAATSSYKDVVLSAQRNTGLNQDIAVESNFQDASTRPLQGSLANSSNPVPIEGVCIVSVDETSELEVGYIIKNDKIFYFKLDELGTDATIIQYLSPPSSTTWIAIRGNYGLTVVVEASYSNGTSVLVTIKACFENQTVNDTKNPTDIPPSGSTTTNTPQNVTNPSTEPCVTEEPMATTNVTNGTVNSSTSTDDSHKNIEPAYIVCAFIAGVISALSIVAVVMMLRHFRNSERCDIT